MAPNIDWLSRFLASVSLSGRVEIRCSYGAPWNVTYQDSPIGEMPYHVVMAGTAVLEGPRGEEGDRLSAGDIVLYPHGDGHVLRDATGVPPGPVTEREVLNVLLSENTGTGERLEMVCGRFMIAAPHSRWLREYFPSVLVVRRGESHGEATATAQLHALLSLMRGEADAERLGGYALLNALSAALFTLVLRASSEGASSPPGLLMLASHPRLAPAIAAMFDQPARAWTLPELAALSSMSRATFMRRFQDALGRSATDLLQDIRISLAANALKTSTLATEAIADAVGYRSVAAFRRVFTERTGMTPGSWRREFTPGLKA